jgi:WhiB family transcriptional regulator, redox-sensing transcriptional regulator
MTEQDVYVRRRLGGLVSRKWEYARTYEAWKIDAACGSADPELFFPKPDGQRNHSRRTRLMIAKAKTLCSVCPVVGECLGYAVQLDLRYGIWGGLTESERATLTGRRAE